MPGTVSSKDRHGSSRTMAFLRATLIALVGLVWSCDARMTSVSTLPTFNHDITLPTDRPLIIAHRGSSGMIPEHTVRAYELAIVQGADIIECDVSVTRDLQLVCRHESWLNKTTDVADKFPDRVNTYYIPAKDENITDYFTVDFTLAELKTLRARQPLEFRDLSYDGQFEIATLEEYIELAQNADRPIGIYPETKDPEFVNNLDIIKSNSTSFEKLVVDVVTAYGYTKKTDPCFLQSFSEDSVRTLAGMTDLPLILLLRSNFGNVSDEYLSEFADICYGIGPSKSLIVAVDSVTSHITWTSDLVKRVHEHGLRIHPYTFRNEDRYLAFDYGQDSYNEYEKFFELELDGYFTDFPATLFHYLDSKYTLDVCVNGAPAGAGKPWLFICLAIFAVFSARWLSSS